MSEETIVISPHMTVKQLAELCEKHDGYVHIESVGGRVYAYLRPYDEDLYIPSFLRKEQA